MSTSEQPRAHDRFTDDSDVTLDLQLPFNRCWDEGPYPALLRYDGPPPGKMSKADVKWCLDLLREKRMT